MSNLKWPLITESFCCFFSEVFYISEAATRTKRAKRAKRVKRVCLPLQKLQDSSSFVLIHEWNCYFLRSSAFFFWWFMFLEVSFKAVRREKFSVLEKLKPSLIVCEVKGDDWTWSLCRLILLLVTMTTKLQRFQRRVSVWESSDLRVSRWNALLLLRFVSLCLNRRQRSFAPLQPWGTKPRHKTNETRERSLYNRLSMLHFLPDARRRSAPRREDRRGPGRVTGSLWTDTWRRPWRRAAGGERHRRRRYSFLFHSSMIHLFQV